MTETLLAENEILKRRVAELESERDKAITERDAAVYDMIGYCEFCKFYKFNAEEMPCTDCVSCSSSVGWEWKGVTDD